MIDMRVQAQGGTFASTPFDAKFDATIRNGTQFNFVYHQYDVKYDDKGRIISYRYEQTGWVDGGQDKAPNWRNSGGEVYNKKFNSIGQVIESMTYWWQGAGK